MRQITEYLLSKDKKNNTIYADIEEDSKFMFSNDEIANIIDAFNESNMRPLVVTNKFASKAGPLIHHANMVLAHFSKDWEQHPLYIYPFEIDCITFSKPGYYSSGDFYIEIDVYKKGEQFCSEAIKTHNLTQTMKEIKNMKSPF